MLPVLLAGDSHVQGLAPRAEEVARAFGREFYARHRDGLRTDQAAAQVAAWRSETGAREVWLSLGTNDLEDPAAFAAAAEAVVAALPADVAVSWWSPPPMTREPYAESARVKTEVLLDLRRRGGFVEVVDSRRFAPVSPDVHYDAAGYAAWARRAALLSCLGAVDTRGAPADLLVALADAESQVDFDEVNPTSHATGAWQVTGILLVDHLRRTGRRYSLGQMTDPRLAVDVAGTYLSLILSRFDELGFAQDLQDREYVGVVAAAYNAGLAEVAGIVRQMLSQGEHVTADAVVSRTRRPERTFHRQVVLGFFRGMREAADPGAVVPAPGGRSRGGGVLLAAGAFGLGIWLLGRRR